MRLIATIEMDITTAEAELQKAKEYLGSLRKELREAQHAAGVEAGHPWLDKKVRRIETTYRGERTQRGVVKIAGPNGYSRRGYWAKPGEVFVVSESGATAYRMKAMNNQTDWVLDA